jgi:hypothetical protein
VVSAMDPYSRILGFYTGSMNINTITISYVLRMNVRAGRMCSIGLSNASLLSVVVHALYVLLLDEFETSQG